jgi:hypothetical protein
MESEEDGDDDEPVGKEAEIILTPVTVSGSTEFVDMVYAMRTVLPTDRTINYQSGGEGVGITSALTGIVDIGFSNRTMTQDELNTTNGEFTEILFHEDVSGMKYYMIFDSTNEDAMQFMNFILIPSNQQEIILNFELIQESK